MATANFSFLFVVAFAVPICFAAALTAAQRQSSLSEIQALMAFKRNLHDPLGALDSWDASTPSAPCDWRGVGCYDNRVRELRLPRLHLGGRITDQLADLRELRKLSLHSNNLNGSIPSSLSQCALLRAPYFHGNSLSGTLPPGIFNLTNLQILNVAQNFLSGTIPGNIPVSLRYLDLSSNTFYGEIPMNFSAESSLQLINLSFNRFSGVVPATIGGLKNLEYLWLDSNQLYGTLPSAISNCSSLVHLSADDNALRGLVPTTIGAMPKLQVVSLSPKTLLESDRYICEICNQGFQRDQNLQMHRRRHKVPWKLLKRESPVVKKRVFVCPEPSCLHHDPCHALGDLVGIKKHFRRKHSNHKQWVCDKCSKGD